VEITEQIAASGDDGRAYGSSFINNQAHAASGNFSSTAFNSFFRFTNVSIPVGATIVSAKITFKCQNAESNNTCNLKLAFQDADDPAAPTTYSGVMDAPVTSFVNWNSIGSWTLNDWYDSPDLSSILQSVIDRAGWAENNAVIAHLRDNGSSANALRWPYQYDGGAANAAKLIVSYHL
jgi:hypothetical protein